MCRLSTARVPLSAPEHPLSLLELIERSLPPKNALRYCMSVKVRACVKSLHACVHVSVSACAPACEHACVRTCVPVSGSVFVRLYVWEALRQCVTR
jgi:hypothetical protein